MNENPLGAYGHTYFFFIINYLIERCEIMSLLLNIYVTNNLILIEYLVKTSAILEV